MNNIPRYQASMPLQTSFVANFDKSGDHIFTQLERAGQFAVYKRIDSVTGRVKGFETIKITVVPKGTVFAKGAKPTESDYESYPGGKAFGRTGWFFPTEEAAFKKFDKLVMGA